MTTVKLETISSRLSWRKRLQKFWRSALKSMQHEIGKREWTGPAHTLRHEDIFEIGLPDGTLARAKVTTLIVVSRTSITLPVTSLSSLRMKQEELEQMIDRKLSEAAYP